MISFHAPCSYCTIPAWTYVANVDTRYFPAATKIGKCKNLAFNIGECVSRGLETVWSRWSHVYRESHPQACKRPLGACR